MSSDLHRLASQLSDQKSSLEASLSAARQEADCLREQLRQAERISLSSAMSNQIPSSMNLNAIKKDLKMVTAGPVLGSEWKNQVKAIFKNVKRSEDSFSVSGSMTSIV